MQQEGGPELPPPRQSNDVVTEGYVPPELLLGAQSYGPEVDIWVSSIAHATHSTGSNIAQQHTAYSTRHKLHSIRHSSTSSTAYGTSSTAYGTSSTSSAAGRHKQHRRMTAVDLTNHDWCACVRVQGVGCVFAELMLRRPFMGGPFLRGGKTGERVTEDQRERLKYRGMYYAFPITRST